MLNRWLYALSVVLMVGCGPSDSRPQALPPAADSVTAPVVHSAPAVPEEMRVPTAEDSALVALDGEGLRWVEVPSGRTRLIAFGSPAGMAEDALVRVWGPWRERLPIPDCGAEPPMQVTWSNGISVLLVDSVFAGWSATTPRPAPGPGSRSDVQSMAGLGIGATRAEVEDAYALDVRQTTLGTEFEAGGIFGVFDGAALDDAVTALWAGRACIYR